MFAVTDPAQRRAGNMSKAMVTLAADMASFNNASPEETLQALRSGLAGETEPLRRFGVFLNEARIQEAALRLGLVKQGEKLSAAAKAQATYSIILKDTNDAQGDFAKTSDSVANKERIKAAVRATLVHFWTRVLPGYHPLPRLFLEPRQEVEREGCALRDCQVPPLAPPPARTRASRR